MILYFEYSLMIGCIYEWEAKVRNNLMTGSSKATPDVSEKVAAMIVIPAKNDADFNHWTTQERVIKRLNFNGMKFLEEIR